MKTTPFPQVNMLLVSKNSRKQRESMYGPLPRIGLAIIDYQRVAEIDAFYTLCQNQRDYYRDPYGKVRSIDFFDNHAKKFASRPDPATVYFKQPIRNIMEMQPIMYPLTDEYLRPKRMPEPIVLRGFYDEKPCFRFRR